WGGRAAGRGEREKCCGAFVRGGDRNSPADKIKEALKRLLDRRFVVVKPRPTATTAAAYWASLGLPPETAETNLQKCRVRIQAIDVAGTAELDAALRERGVRVGNRSGKLTVTFVGDYLDMRLVELNRQRSSSCTPWLL